MIIDYYLINPTENITLLVETPVSRELQPFVASELLKLEKRGEQVGFIEQNSPCDISVRMAGGEFCGNAAISAASLYTELYGKKECISVCLSGVELNVIFRENDEKFKFSAVLLNNAEIGEVSFKYGGEDYALPIVSLYGISHIIADKATFEPDPEKIIKNICREINADALGIMLYDFDENRLTPLVYVPKGDTLYWENSCASGTAALGAYLFNEKKEKISLDVTETGGVLNITADENNLILSGNAYSEYKNQADISI